VVRAPALSALEMAEQEWAVFKEPRLALPMRRRGSPGSSSTRVAVARDAADAE